MNSTLRGDRHGPRLRSSALPPPTVDLNPGAAETKETMSKLPGNLRYASTLEPWQRASNEYAKAFIDFTAKRLELTQASAENGEREVQALAQAELEARHKTFAMFGVLRRAF